MTVDLECQLLGLDAVVELALLLGVAHGPRLLGPDVGRRAGARRADPPS
jgi:hypothetical protein